MVKSIIFVAVFFIMLLSLDLFCTRVVPGNTTIKNYWILNTKNEKFDYAFIGPSRILHSIDGDIFKNKAGKSVINLGLSGAAYAEQYLILNSFIRNNKNKLKELFIEVSYYNFIHPDSAFSYPFHEYYYFPYIKEDYVFNTVLENSKSKLKAYFWRYIPFVRYAEFNTEFLPLILFRSDYEDNQVSVSFDKYGTEFIKNTADTLKLKSHYYKNNEMNEVTLLYLEKMINVAMENNIKVSLLTTPVYRKRVKYSASALQNYKLTVEELVKKYKLEYFDFEDKQISLKIENFHDYTHLNEHGAAAFSSEFSEALLKRNE